MADWTTQVADAVEGVVDIARERAVEPVRAVARGIVYGLVGLFFFSTALVVLAIGGFRALDAYLPSSWSSWGAHLLLGGIFVAGGLFAWARRQAPRS